MENAKNLFFLIPTLILKTPKVKSHFEHLKTCLQNAKTQFSGELLAFEKKAWDQSISSFPIVWWSGSRHMASLTKASHLPPYTIALTINCQQFDLQHSTWTHEHKYPQI